MVSSNWGSLSPEKVSDWINFDREDSEWKYSSSNSISMPAKQAEGVAYLWNILALNDTAILADEVGMGKTFQALGVISLLWKMKPEAKVLVIAPNRDICKHWVREYTSFLSEHYRDIDHLVRNAVDGGPVNVPKLCWRLNDLVKSLNTGSGSFFLTTIHSLSGLVSMEEKSNIQGDNARRAAKEANSINKKIKNIIGDEGFDLIIVDEAHYFRNSNGTSQRVHAARALFGEKGNRLGQKNLLLTATPSHSGLDDIKNILSYFISLDDEIDNDNVTKLLEKYALRRLRLMKGQDNYHNKHSYRNEIAVPADFSENPESELFFALYQKKLVKELGQSKTGKRFLYGYLEGFESVGDSDINNYSSENNNEESESAKESFSKAPDTEILQRLTKEYYKRFNDFPKHPKYGVLVKEFVPDDIFDATRDLHDDKHLVFVRRIPSVRELTQRVNAAYDKKLIEKIIAAWGLKKTDPRVKRWKKKSWSREGYIDMLQQLNPDYEKDESFIDEKDSDANAIDESKLGSKVADLFVVKKGKGGRTDCSNVSLRFRKPESLFSIFLEPASDYKKAGYHEYYKNDGVHNKREYYSTAARNVRVSNFDDLTRKIEIASDLKVKKGQYKHEVQTAWGLMYESLDSEHYEKLSKWFNKDPAIIENFGNYIKTGFLFASPVLVEIYCWFTEFNLIDETSDVQDKYYKFLRWVEPKISTSLMLSYFKSALESFDNLCGKIVDHQLSDWKKDWRTLTGLQNPAWYASGESSNRQRLILGFNSPFYPNVLVATSVFQEGVNLHMQCKKVHHYGIAWTPGDNEQRVGRVDRLFGKVNEQIIKNGVTKLDIHYPYLKNSFDEDQVGSFIKSKRSVEEKMDACIHSSFNTEIDTKTSNENWRDYLRTPEHNSKIVDPYPAKFSADRYPSFEYCPLSVHYDSDISGHIQQQIESILNNKHEKLYPVVKNSHNPNALFLIDPIVQNNDLYRRQPILIERHFSPEFSSLIDGTVYYITLKSPIASREVLSSNDDLMIVKAYELFNLHSNKYPLIRLALADDFSLSHFYLHMKVELPVFIRKGHLAMLSKQEINESFQQLKAFSDLLENELFQGERDLKKEELIINDHLSESSLNLSKGINKKCKTLLGKSWEKIEYQSGVFARLSCHISQDKVFKMLNEKSRYDSEDKKIPLLLKNNNDYPFILFSEQSNKYSISLSFPVSDFQEEEQALLKRWFDYVASIFI